MGIAINRQNGQNYAENLADPILLFDSGTWTIASGTGTASLDSNNRYVGSKSLKVQNNVVESSITANNSVQNTVIDLGGEHQISFYAKKDIALEVRSFSLLIYQNAVLLDTQTFSLGSTDSDLDVNNKWVRFQCDTSYTFTKGDVITFQFRINSAVTSELTTTVYFDGFAINRDDRRNVIVPNYSKPVDLLYNQFTGWADYVDTTYTTGSPFTVVDGASVVALPNNAGGGVTSQTPVDIDTFYDGTVIKGREGDGISVTIEFKCRPSGAGANPRLTVSIDIGGSIGEIYVRDFFLTKGSGVEHNYLSSFNAYNLNTWEANGGTVKVLATNEDIEIYNIRYVITRTHKAR